MYIYYYYQDLEGIIYVNHNNTWQGDMATTIFFSFGSKTTYQCMIIMRELLNFRARQRANVNYVDNISLVYNTFPYISKFFSICFHIFVIRFGC